MVFLRRINFFNKIILILGIIGALNFYSFHAKIDSLKKAKEKLSIQEKLGNQISIDTKFKNEKGEIVPLKNYLKEGKPVILTPVYYSCPHLCTLILNGLLDAINKEKSFYPESDYEIISISMDHEETHELAKLKKDNYFEKLTLSKDRKAEARKGWHFLTGSKKNVKKIFSEVGFSYEKQGDEYAHTATIIFLTSQGKIARYLYGVTYKENDFKMAILESSEGKISSFIDQVIFYCFRYDPAKRTYSLIAWKVMFAGSITVVLLLSGLLAYLWFWERRKNSIIQKR